MRPFGEFEKVELSRKFDAYSPSICPSIYLGVYLTLEIS